MKLYMESSNNVRNYGGSALNQLAEKLISGVKSRKQENLAAISQKISGMNQESTTEKTEKPDVIEIQQEKTKAKPEKIEDLVSFGMERYRNGVESAAGNLEYYSEKIKYLLSEKEKYQNTAVGNFPDEDKKQIESYKSIAPEGYDCEGYYMQQATDQVELLDKELDMVFKGIEEITNSHFSMAEGFNKMSFSQYTNEDEIKEIYQQQIGGMLNSLNSEKLGLSDMSKDWDEILSKLDKAITTLDDVGEQIESRYQSYSGKEMNVYAERKGREELQDLVAREPLHALLQKELKPGGPIGPYQIYIGDINIKNLVDVKA